MNDLTVEAVRAMHYSQLVGLVRERNRPSGGLQTVHVVAVNALLSSRSRVLEIGSNTGFTSANLAAMTRCEVVGIDLDPRSVEEARRYADSLGVLGRVRFEVEDATNLPHEGESFDLVWASNVTSFIEDKAGAVCEYLRVLRRGGFLAMVPIYYLRPPPPELVERVGRALDVSLRVWSKREWIELCHDVAARGGQALDLVFQRDYRYLDRADALDRHCALVLDALHLRDLPPDVWAALAERYREMMGLFNENLGYCGYSILLFQKREQAEEPELFLSVPRDDDVEA